VVTPAQKEQTVQYIREVYNKASRSRACKLVGSSRTKMYYEKKMPKKDTMVKAIILQVLGTRRLGRNKVIPLVQRIEPSLSASKIRRVYKREGFSLQSRMRKSRVNNPANPIEIPLAKNQEWAMDFMSDSLCNGRKFRALNVIDHYNRLCLGIEIDHGLAAQKVVLFMEKLIEIHGKPKQIRTDNGPEFISKRFQTWLNNNNITWSRIEKGKPQQNAIVERFNRTYREDILDANIFESLEHARSLTEQWIIDYNEKRPHQSLNNLTPKEYEAA